MLSIMSVFSQSEMHGSVSQCVFGDTSVAASRLLHAIPDI